MKYKKLLKFYKNISETNKFLLYIIVYIYYIACHTISDTRHRK